MNDNNLKIFHDIEKRNAEATTDSAHHEEVTEAPKVKDKEKEEKHDYKDTVEPPKEEGYEGTVEKINNDRFHEIEKRNNDALTESAHGHE